MCVKILLDLYYCLACDARIFLFVSALWLRDISKVWIHGNLYLFGCQRQDAWNLHILSCIRGPVGPISSRCNVLLCRSVLVPGGGNEIPVMKSAAVVLERYIHCYWMLNVRNLTECKKRNSDFKNHILIKWIWCSSFLIYMYLYFPLIFCYSYILLGQKSISHNGS